MAKKSAKSKGYRKQNAKKPYLSRKDIVILCLAIVAIGIGAFFLFRYDDGALKVQDGAVVTDGDNWLIVNGSNARGRARYFKLGEVGEIDGYARTKGPVSTDANLSEFSFAAQAEDLSVESISVSCAHNSAKALTDYTAAWLKEIDTNSDFSEIQTAELGGYTATYYTYLTSPSEEAAEEDAGETAEAAVEAVEEAEPAEEAAEEEASQPAKEAEAPVYARSIAAYVDTARESCFVFHADGTADTAEGCPTDEALVAALEQAIAAVTPEPEK